jgi:hypothetical protein
MGATGAYKGKKPSEDRAPCHLMTHLSLLSHKRDCPQSRLIQPPACGQVIAVPEAGGLHHHYERVAA